jgi:hypothetical protein
MNVPNQLAKTPKERNQETWKRHRQEVFRQVTLPLIIGGSVLGLISVLVVLGSSVDIARWADISIIWLIIPTLFFAFLAMLALAGMVYLTIRLIVNLPFISYRILRKLKEMQAVVRSVSDRVTAPFIKAAGVSASIRTAILWPVKGKAPASRHSVSGEK